MFNIVKNRFVLYSVSAVIILIGVVMAFVNGGFNLDVEFAGGTEIYAELGKAFDSNAMQKAVDAVTEKNAKVQTVDGTNASIKLAEISDEEITAIREVLEETGIHIQILPQFASKSEYTIQGRVEKSVTIFLAKTKDTQTPEMSEK